MKKTGGSSKSFVKTVNATIKANPEFAKYLRYGPSAVPAECLGDGGILLDRRITEAIKKT